jgi:RNA binding domain
MVINRSNVDIPDHSNVFLVQKFPVNWKTADLQMALKDLGYTTIKWIDDQSCLVIVRDTAKVELAVDMTKRTIKKKSKFVITRFTGHSLPVDEDEHVRESGGPKRWLPTFPSSRKRARSQSPEVVQVTKKSKKNCLLM